MLLSLCVFDVIVSLCIWCYCLSVYLMLLSLCVFDVIVSLCI